MRRTVLFFAWPQWDAAELEFWRDLERALAARGLELLLVSASPPPADLAIDHVPFVPTIDSLWAGHGAAPLPATLLDLDPRLLLEREEEWSGPAVVQAVRELRRQALDSIASHTIQLLAAVQPVAALIWNGHHVPEMILDAALRQGGTPVTYVERAPIPRTLFADEQGLSSASAIARQPSWPSPGPRWLRRADELSARIAAGGLTWWDQPDARGAGPLRQRLNVPQHARVVMFAGQVDQDTQRFLFSRVFRDNLDAWRWLAGALAGRDDVFVLGKHHPKSTLPPEAYERVLKELGVNGEWRTDIAIDDALAVADRVAAVNSTVLYEGLARGIPALSMGDWLLGGRGVAHEVRDRASGLPVIERWLAGADAEAHRASWRESLGFLASRCLYAYEREAVRAGSLGADDLAARIASRAAAAGWRPPERVIDAWRRAQRRRCWRDPDDAAHAGTPGDPTVGAWWQAAHALRYCVLQARAAASRGRRVVVWGTGEAGRTLFGLLATAGVTPGAFVESRPQRHSVDGTPVIAPDALRAGSSRDLVLVASVAAGDILPQLADRGFETSRDVLAIDCGSLRALATTAEAVAC